MGSYHLNKFYVYSSDLIKWHKQDQQADNSSDFENRKDDLLDEMPYFLKGASRAEAENVLKGIKEVNIN